MDIVVATNQLKASAESLNTAPFLLSGLLYVVIVGSVLYRFSGEVLGLLQRSSSCSILKGSGDATPLCFCLCDCRDIWYIGSLVGDFYWTLLYGGIYEYPRDKKSKNGKLRLLYECAPMSFIVEQAGGKGSDDHQRVLDIQPTEIHQRVPLYIGSQEEVEKLEKYLA
ncbi:fructose-1,6-bisphosphatase, chloroplastic-like [Pistacia vera]|uniref:fructose-1,6-bisphosphatase, chloroplastic-like n=1 Tax=Pistacia vera TaxID=55513 RepID=UPI0012635750|nr:fructose-1,6-bisphosphatase, chloroplastic-like [Pistacia vera]